MVRISYYQGKSSKWSVKRDLYDWWKGKIIENATYGHRYFCLMCLAIFAIKCDVPEEELKLRCISVSSDFGQAV